MSFQSKNDQLQGELKKLGALSTTFDDLSKKAQANQGSIQDIQVQTRDATQVLMSHLVTMGSEMISLLSLQSDEVAKTTSNLESMTEWCNATHTNAGLVVLEAQSKTLAWQHQPGQKTTPITDALTPQLAPKSTTHAPTFSFASEVSATSLSKIPVVDTQTLFPTAPRPVKKSQTTQ